MCSLFLVYSYTQIVPLSNTATITTAVGAPLKHVPGQLGDSCYVYHGCKLLKF